MTWDVGVVLLGIRLNIMPTRIRCLTGTLHDYS